MIAPGTYIVVLVTLSVAVFLGIVALWRQILRLNSRIAAGKLGLQEAEEQIVMLNGTIEQTDSQLVSATEECVRLRFEIKCNRKESEILTSKIDVEKHIQCILGYEETISNESLGWCEQIETAIQETETAISDAISGFMAIASRASQTSKEAQLAFAGHGNVSLESLAGDASEIVGKFLENVQTSADEMNGLASHMAETLEISSKMYRLLDELERIHGQTNLLSLNASVEAARTGQSNNGFGVVAQELRSLSNRSENAAVSLRKLTEELDTHSHVVQGGLEHVIKICLLNSTSVQTDINALLKSICLVGEHTSESVKELTRLTECVGTDIGSVITALQFQDLLRQRLEHVANPLRLLSTPAISINSSQSPEVPSPKEIRTKSAVNDINRQPIKAAENTIVRKAGMAPTLQIVSFERKAEEEDNITLF